MSFGARMRRAAPAERVGILKSVACDQARSRYPRRRLRSSHFSSSICATRRDGCRSIRSTPRAPDATPAAHERQILEERRFDRQDIKSSHVLGAVDPFEHENLKKGRIVRVRGHGPKLRRKNSLASNE